MNPFGRLRRFVTDYTDGLDVRTAPRTLRRDAERAYSILTREHAGAPEPRGAVKRAWYRTRIAFLGLSSKLSPPRRILFAASLGLFLVALYLNQISDRVEIYGLLNPTVLSIVAVLGLVLVLALELADRVTVRDELEVARQLQRDLLPAAAPPVEGLSFAFSYRTANTIGGDYYDFLPLADGRLAVVIGDASGHGIAAGLLMAIAKAALELAIDVDPAPAAVAPRLNRTLYRTGGRRDFMTLFYGVIDPATGRLEYVVVGHPYPILRRTGGRIIELGSGSLPLGIRPTIEPAGGVATLEPGDLLVLYTDGVPETVDASGAAFGFERLRGLVAAGGEPAAVHDRIVAAVESFSGGGPVYDDRSLVVVRRDR